MDKDLVDDIRNGFIWLYEWAKEAAEKHNDPVVSQKRWDNFCGEWDELNEMLPYLSAVREQLLEGSDE